MDPLDLLQRYPHPVDLLHRANQLDQLFPADQWHHRYLLVRLDLFPADRSDQYSQIPLLDLLCCLQVRSARYHLWHRYRPCFLLDRYRQLDHPVAQLAQLDRLHCLQVRSDQ